MSDSPQDWVMEGLDIRSEMKSWRKTTCKILLGHLKEVQSVLVSAPPFSGKSSLATLFEEFANKFFQTTIFITPLRNQHNDYDLEYTLQKKTTLNSEQLLESSALKGKKERNLTILIIDEVQLTYKDNKIFWDNMKLHSKSYNFYLLCFAGYGSNVPDTSITTPMIFDIYFGMDLMQLTPDEYDEFIAGYLNSDKGKQVPIPIETQSFLSESTKNHVGMIKWSLYNIHKQFINNKLPPHETLFEYLNSMSYLTVMKGVRAIPVKRSENDKDNLTIGEIEVLRSVMLYKEITVYDEDSQFKIVSELVRKGYIGCQKDKRFCFASDLIRKIFIDTLIRPKAQILDITIENYSLHDAVILVVERMSKDSLFAAAKFKNDHVLYERAYQMEFYRAFSLFVRSDKALSVDVPPPKNNMMIKEEEHKNDNSDKEQNKEQRGYLDFYYNQSTKWAIELLREGSLHRVEEHLGRFGKNGKYKNIPKNDYIVVDFRSTPLNKLFEIEDEHYMRVQFDEKFEKVEVYSNPNGIKKVKRFNLEK